MSGWTISNAVFIHIVGIWLHECGAIGASSDGIVVVPLMPHCSVSLHDDSSADLVSNIVDVKYPFAATGKTIAEAAETIAPFPLGDSSRYVHYKYYMTITTLH